MSKLLQLTLRRWRKTKLYPAIIIFCLTTGITCMLFAILYWNEEHSFDNFHSNKADLYRITTTMIENKGDLPITSGGTAQVHGPAFQKDIPEFLRYTRVLGGDITSDVVAKGKALRLNSLFVDSNFLQLFSFPLVAGDAKTALSDMHAVVLTEKSAARFFGAENPVGKWIALDADPSFKQLGKPMQVTAVVKDPPANSSIQFDVLFNFQFLQLSFQDDAWISAYLGTFVQLRPGASIAAVEQKMNAVYNVYAKDQVSQSIKTYGYDPTLRFNLQPIQQIHLQPLMRIGSNAEGGINNGSRPTFAWLFVGIAFFILLMAAINFINITIANSLRRAKEVGIRKISGGSRASIVAQFVFESMLLCLGAFLLSLLFVYALLPYFNTLAGKRIQVSVDPTVALYAFAILVLIIALTSLYPALIISRYSPAEVLYNRQSRGGKNAWARALVVFQFALAIFLLISSLVYYRQMRFVQHSDLGYNADDIVRTNINGDREYKQVKPLLRNELKKMPGVISISFGSDGSPYDAVVNGKSIRTIHKAIDEAFLPTMNIPLKLGRNFSDSLATDLDQSAIVNEAFVRAAGLENPIGTVIITNKNFDEKPKTIVGVVKDFHSGSLREAIPPMVMFENNWSSGGIWIKLSKERPAETLSGLEKIYKSVMPGSVFEYSMLTDLNSKMYTQEKYWQRVISGATVISFLVCCLGLFGLAHLTTNRRVKEIGIRKVLGATVQNIAMLVSTDFLKLVFIAFLVAAPASWFIMNRWLQDFAYRIEIGPLVFLVAAALAISIALLTVGWQSMKAARANPVNSLRSAE